MNSGAHEGYVVPVSYKTPTVLRVTHIVKSGKNLLSVMKEKIHQRKRGKDQLSFKIWILHNGQPKVITNK